MLFVGASVQPSTCAGSKLRTLAVIVRSSKSSFPRLCSRPLQTEYICEPGRRIIAYRGSSAAEEQDSCPISHSSEENSSPTRLPERSAIAGPNDPVARTRQANNLEGTLKTCA